MSAAKLPILENFCWAEIRAATGRVARPCLFLDRDGVVIADRHHLANPEGVELLPGAIAAVTAARAQGWFVGLVTNQSGIGRGLFGWREFAAVQTRVEQEIGSRQLDFVCACPHHAGGMAPFDQPDHAWRKPNPGMLLHAAAALNIDMPASIMVGDRASDIVAGTRAGVGRTFLVGCLPGEDEAARASGHPFTRVSDLTVVVQTMTASE